MRLSEEQKFVIREVVKLSKPVTKVGGFAGSGKSTLIKHLIHMLPDFSVCAFTGKAANVLRKKGMNAGTIHSLIYKPIKGDDGEVRFSLAPTLDFEGVIVDEASMVSKDIYEDLRSFGKPIIFVGDHGQLEPVADKFNLMAEPDYKLETIHRNAGEIAHFAEYVRKGYKPSSWEVRNGSGKSISFLPRGGYKNLVAEVDQVICAFNKLRCDVNRMVRNSLGREGEQPVPGDKVMCLKNNRTLGVFNGMQGYVSEVYPGAELIVFQSDGYSLVVPYDKDSFNQVKYDFKFGSKNIPFDYAYAATCHKCQGDEFEKVLVLEQKCDLWDHRRWAYTAASRAKSHLYWCEV